MAMQGNRYSKYLGQPAPESLDPEQVEVTPVAEPTPEPAPPAEPLTRTSNRYAQFVGAAPAPAPTPEEPIDNTWEDYGRSLMSGGARVVQGMGWLVEQVGKAADEYGVDLPGGMAQGVAGAGRSIKELAGKSADTWMRGRLDAFGLDQEGLSPQAQKAMELEYLGEASMGEKWQRLKLDGIGSLLGTAAGMGLGAILARSLAAAGMRTAEGLRSTAANTIGFGAGEAAVAAPSTGASTEEEVQKLFDERGHEAWLEDSKEYRLVYDALSGIDDKYERIAKAQEMLADAAAGKAAAINTVTSFIFGAGAGHYLGKIMGEGGNIARRVGTGATTETIQEFGQSGAEQMAQNFGVQTLDQSRRLTEGALEAAVGGAAAGAAMGGVFGAAAPANPDNPGSPGGPPSLLDQIENAQNRVAAGTGDALDDALAEAETGLLETERTAEMNRIGRGMNTVDAIRAFNDASGRLPTYDEIQEFKKTGKFPAPTPEPAAGPQTLEEQAAARRKERQRAAQQRIEEDERADREYGAEEQAKEDAARSKQQERAARRYEAQQDTRARAETLAQEVAGTVKGLDVEAAERQRRQEEKAKRDADFEAAERQRAEQEERRKEQDARRARAQVAEQEAEQAEARTKVDEPGPTIGDTAAGKGLRAALQARREAAARQNATTAAEVDAGAQTAATSPENDLPQPTQEQIEAGNYAKGKVKVQGLDISIENPKGSTREGPGWKTKMRDHYGYVRRSDGADGEQVDVFVGDKPESETVYVVDQVNQETGEFDEHKAMVGYGSKFEAARAYRRNYGKKWKVGQVTEMPVSEFKRWLKEGDGTRPIAEQQADTPPRAPRATPLNWATTPERGATKRTAKDMRSGKYELVDVPVEDVLNQVGETFDPRVPGNQVGNRLAQARERLDAGQPMDPPVLGAAASGNVMFEDGRHRALAALELGERTIPALVPKGEVEAVTQRLPGARRRGAPVPEQGQMDLAPAEAPPAAGPTKRVTVSKTMLDALPATLGAASTARRKLQEAAAAGTTKVDMTEAEAAELVDVLETRRDDTSLPRGARRAAEKLLERVEQTRSDLFAARTAPDEDLGEFADNATANDVVIVDTAPAPAPAQDRDPTKVEGYGQIRTKTLRRLVESDDRIVGVSIEDGDVFIHTDSTQWSDDAGAGSFRGASETEAVRNFKERVQRAGETELDLEDGFTDLPTIEGLPDDFELIEDGFPAKERSRLKTMVEAWRRKHPAAKFQIVNTVEELPQDILDALQEMGKTTRAAGLYDRTTGRAFAILENAPEQTAERVMRTIMHEVVQHQGMRGLLGIAKWHQLLDQIWHNGNQNAIRAIAKRYGHDITKQRDRRKAVDEYMADIAGSERGFDSSWLQRAIDEIRAFLRELGVLDSWTDNDIRRLLRMSRERLKNPGAQIVLESGKVVDLELGDDNQAIARDISAISIFEGDEDLQVTGARGDRALMEIFTQRTRAANRGKRLDARTRRNKDILSDVMVEEVNYALMQSGHAADWYSASLAEAVEIVGEMHPEVRDSAEARSLFMLGLAITSNGSDVQSNAQAAERVWRHYKRYRKFPTDIGVGPTGGEVNDSFDRANAWIEKLGTEEFVRFLNTGYTVGELNLLGVSVSGESVNHQTYGSAMFGPKIGGGFYQNLMGNFDPLTMDRWWMKMWGRITGTGLPAGVPATTKNKFLAQVEQNPDLVEMYGMDQQAVLRDDKKLFELARRVHRAFSADGYKDRTDFNRAAKNVDLYVTGVVLDPGSASNRAWMREVTAMARQKLADRNIEINTASLQALLWYPEKELYRKYAGSSERAEGIDYATAFEQIFREKGGTQDRVDAARQRARAQRSADRARDADQGANKKRDPRVTLQLGHAAAVSVRRLGKPAFQRVDRKRPRQLLSKANAIAEIKPAATTKNRMEKAGLEVPSMFELEGTPEAAAIFRRRILAAKRSNGAMGSVVHVYDQSDYEGMRLFMNDAGTVGFALKGDDIVSLFKNSKAKNIKGAGIWSPLMAVQEGGRRLDAFDTVLPHMYAGAGFKVVARTPFNEEFQPDGWSQQAFKEFNGGKPDVVFMAYDKSHDLPYGGRREGEMLDYDAAAERQLAEVERLNERNKPSGVELDLEINDDEKTAAVNSSPENPLARLHKMGATAEAQSKYAPNQRSIIRRVLDSGSDLAIQAATVTVPRRYLSDFVENINMPQVDEYLRTANRMTGRRNELLTEYEDVVARWSKFTHENKREAGLLSEIMHASTLAGTDPSKPFKLRKPMNKLTPQEKLQEKVRMEQHQILKGHYDGMSQEAKGLYNEVRDSYQKQRRRVEEALYRRIEESVADGRRRAALNAALRQKFEAGRVEGPYFPLMRFGEYFAVAKDAGGEVVSFSKFESRDAQRAWTQEFRGAGYEVTEGRKVGDAETIDSVDPEFVRRVQEIVGDTALQDEIWQMYLRTLPEMSVRKQFIHRKGRLGFAADALRAYGHLMFHGAHQTARVEYMPQLQDTLQRMKERAQTIQNEGDDTARMTSKHVYDEMEKRHKASMSPSTSALANGLTSFGFAWYLGATPAAALVNLTQTALVGYPVLGARFGAVDSAKELLRLSQWYGSARGNLGDGLRGDEQAAFKEASRIGLFERTMAHDIAGVAEEGALNYDGARARTMRAVSWFFHRAEQMNREVTFMAAYRLSRKKGRTHDDAILEAEDLVWDSHFDYNNENRPRFMQGNMGRVLLLFKQYSLNMTYRITRDFRDSLWAMKPEERKEARRRFAGMMGMTVMMAGASGLPGIATAPISWAINLLLRDDEDDPAFDVEVATRVWLTDMLGATASEAIMKGPVDAFTPITLSNRVGLGELWIRDPKVGDSAEDVFTHYITDMAGPVPAALLNVIRGGSLISEGKVYRGAEKMVPKFIADMLKAYRYGTEGALTLHTPADTLMANDDFGLGQLFAQAVGFTPSDLTLRYEQNEALRNAETRLQNRRQELIDRYALAFFNEDKKEMQDRVQQIVAFNQKYPTLSVNANQLSRSLRTRAEQSAQSLNGLRINPNLRYLEKTLRFTPEEEVQ